MGIRPRHSGAPAREGPHVEGDAGLHAGYVFCCSGVFIYQYLKFQEVKRAVKDHPGAPLSSDIESSRVAATSPHKPSGGGGGGSSVSLAQSKAAVLKEMRQLEFELGDLERRGPK